MASSLEADLENRVRALLGNTPAVREVRMFGGLCFMRNGNMVVSTMKDGELLVRTGPEGREAALKRPGARPMAMNGREMKGYVIVSASHLGDTALREWIALATVFVDGLPPKP